MPRVLFEVLAKTAFALSEVSERAWRRRPSQAVRKTLDFTQRYRGTWHNGSMKNAVLSWHAARL